MADNSWFTQVSTVTGHLYVAPSDLRRVRAAFERVADAVTVNFTLDRSLTEDQMEEDRVTTTEDVVDPNAQVIDARSVTVVAAPTNEPFYLTRAVLRQLGSCGPYVRTFSDNFPLDRFPNGIEVNQETCSQHYRDWDWDWALTRMLSHEGRVEADRLVRSRAMENRVLGSGVQRRAAAFGRVFATRPDLRHPDMATVRDRAALAADQDAIDEVNNVRQTIRARESDIVRYTESIKRLREANKADNQRLPALEAAAAEPLRRQAEQRHRDAVVAMERMRERFQKSSDAVREAAAEVERFTALVREREASSAGES